LFNLVQHLNGPTQNKGHILDLIITRTNDELVTSIEIQDPMLSDHSAVHCKLCPKKPPLEQMKISYRNLRSINMNSFKDDLKQSDLLTTNAFDLTDLTEKYDNILTEILQRHVPLKRCMITLRPLAPWYHEGINDSKRKCRKLAIVETVCGQTDVCRPVPGSKQNAKSLTASYYSSIISENHQIQKYFLTQSTSYYTTE